MSDQTQFTVGIYSPRWGHDDEYTITLDRDQMLITTHAREAACAWRDNLDPQWSGYNDEPENPLLSILENDSIYPPTVFVNALTHAWLEWRNGVLDDAEIESEVKGLCDWVNQVTHNKPTSDFWKGHM